MSGLRVLFVIFALQSAFSLIEAQQDLDWVVANDFSPSELANLTAKQEHELHLKTLSQMDYSTVFGALILELVAKNIGNDFYEFSVEESANRENNAIAKAIFECHTKILDQDRVSRLITNYVDYDAVMRRAQETGSMSEGFSLMCSKMDQLLKNETCYTVAKEAYKMQNQTSPNKIYQYGIPKSEYDVRAAIAELWNEPKMKKFEVLATYIAFGTPEEDVIVKSILQLAKMPGKAELVQKVYEKSIESVTSKVKDVTPDQMHWDNITHAAHLLGYLKPTLAETLLSNINENADLKKDYEIISKRVRNE